MDSFMRMRLHFFWVLIFVAVAAHNGRAQSHVLHGNVQFANDETGIATVLIRATNQVTVTDNTGHFHFDAITADTVEVEIRAIGYQTAKRRVQLSVDRPATLHVTLAADPLALDQVVVSGTRSAVINYNSPLVVSSIGQRLFEHTQSVSAAEGLNFTPGLRMENNCQNCGFNQVRMNGLAGAYSQILINSRPIFSALAGVYGLEFIPSAMIDRIEVVRGGGSVMYGGNAIAGTINILTKDPQFSSFEVASNFALTGMQTPDLNTTLSGTHVSPNRNQGISFFYFDRDRAPFDANGDGFSELTRIRNQTLGVFAHHHFNDRSKVSLSAFRMNEHRRGGSDFDREPHQSALTEQLDHVIYSMQASYEHASRDGRQRIAVYSGLQTVARDSYYGAGGRIIHPGDSLTAEDYLALNAYGVSNDISANNGVQFVRALHKRTQLTWGAEHQFNRVHDRMPGYGRRISQTVSTIGSYLQLDQGLGEHLHLLGGVRYDHVDVDGTYALGFGDMTTAHRLNVVLPRVALLYQINTQWRARAGYAEGYRAPQAFDEELHLETVAGTARMTQLANDLEAERSQSTTASLHYSQRTEKQQVSILLEGFATRLHKAFVLGDLQEAPNGVLIATKRNGDGATVSGVNLEMNWATGDKLVCMSGLTYQRALYATDEVLWLPEDNTSALPAVVTRRLLRTPDFYAYFSISYLLTPALELSTSATYTGSMVVPHVIAENGYTALVTTSSFFDLNGRMAYTFQRGALRNLTVTAGMQNIFNQYQDDFDLGADRDAGYVYGPMRPRTVTFGVRYRVEPPHPADRQKP